MHLGKSNPHYSYYMGGIQLKEHKDLGILMDTDLKFHSHSCNVTNKASQMLRKLLPIWTVIRFLYYIRVWYDHTLSKQM